MNLIIIILLQMSFASQWEKMVDQITKMRIEIEVLSKQVDTSAKKENANIDLWSQKKTELEAQLAREQMREKQIHEKIKRLETRVKMDPKMDIHGKKKILNWLSAYETTLAGSAPFHIEKRLETLKSLRQRLDIGHESQEFILADFWLFLESEMKLSQTNDYRIVDVTINGQRKKCEVARLGLQSLFVVTPTGQVLQAVNNGKQWIWVDIEATESKNSVLSLVKNLKNKNTSGYYLLPLSAPQEGASL